MHILIAEDDAVISRSIAEALEDAHLTPDVASTVAEASYKLRTNDYDLVILDRMFPAEELDGDSLARQICDQQKDLPILMLSSKNFLAHRVEGLKGGADYYLTKPFYRPELIACVNTLLRRRDRRRAADRADPGELKHGPLTLDVFACSVSLDGILMQFNHKEFQILRLLLEKAGEVVTRTELIEKVWGDTETHVMSNTIDVHMRRIRNKLGKFGKLIRTIISMGYRLDPWV